MKGEETLRSGGQVKSCLLPGEYARTAPKQSAGIALKSKVASHPPSPSLPYPPPDMKVTWRAAISGHKATFFSDSDFLDPVIPRCVGHLETGVSKAVSSAKELRCVCYWAGGDCNPQPREQAGSKAGT